MLREGKGNLRLVIPGIPGNPGNHIKSKVKFKILSIFMPFYGDDVRSGDGGGEHGG